MIDIDRVVASVSTLLIWACAGALFGTLSAGLYVLFLILGLPGWLAWSTATTASVATTAAICLTLQAALVGAVAGVLASIGYLMASGQTPASYVLILVGAGLGIAAGGCYTWATRYVSHSLSHSASGLLAGLGASAALMVLLATLGAQISMPVLTFGGAVCAGIAFSRLDPWLLRHLGRRLPEYLSATLVAGLVATLVATGIWFVTTVTDGLVAAGSSIGVGPLLGHIRPGIVGGLLGGCVVGIAVGLAPEKDRDPPHGTAPLSGSSR